MSRRSKGDRMRAVKVLETTVEGFFSGSLNKCCKETEYLNDYFFQITRE